MARNTRAALHLLLIAVFSFAVSACGGGGGGVTPGAGDAPAPGFRAAAPVSPLLYVSNLGANTSVASITAYSLDANGNAAPVNTIGGSKTFLNGPQGVAFDALGNMYVTNAAQCGACSTAHVAVFAPGSTGNAVPIAVICGPHTNLSSPVGVAVDASGELLVVNEGSNSVTVYAPGANGDAAPIRTIAGPSTQLSFPQGIAIDSSGLVYVANGGGSGGVNVYDAGASGDAAPVRTIPPAFAAPAFTFSSAVAFDKSGNLYVAGTASGIRGFLAIYAPGSNTPSAQIAGTNTGLDAPDGVALDAAGNAYVTNNSCFPCHVLVFAPGSNGNAAPARTISGDATGLSFPTGDAIH
ncbi:MAG TPA: hypothetical protein VFL13_09715 [Candidatus Baltobacteraceae bacterium]|nr:hypothetical protein [Candidatus Baltobacteraceae bacterium]